ncbi:thiopeptide-type bacteriocin biosynthesis protein [Catalinimonas alkaloidigena]|uniref:thiopeptide-type bacteriocin biosynthesis protein n=1 Tax=Catalinimonas alkaloidigena TaxID=1075417 RepID=UPI0024074D08|nr:thiopeptide-type bacteriocin biosynthesis protein [Catalinimonas alkaloidigena]MDF9799369.1 thiopeptide-type bacteriocin biosynthesis protein [Catalinimonas alkaloidigena]
MERWLSLHMFYNEPWEPLLLQLVKPVCEALYQKQHISQYFFIRYWEHGPHIRLRVKGEAKTLESYVAPYIRQRFRQFATAYPSCRSALDQVHLARGSQKLYPNNSVQTIDYIPETRRYGGTYGLSIAEKQFEASSHVVLEAMSQKPGWHAACALGVAIQMHLSFAHELHMSPAEMIRFFSYLGRSWFSMAYASDKDYSSEERYAMEQKVMHCFSSAYEQQEQHIVSVCASLWQGLQTSSTFKQAWLNLWVSEMRNFRRRIKDAQAQAKLIPPHKNLLKASNPKEATLWNILGSLVHMTNNRLGVLNRDEAYIAFVIQKALSSLNMHERPMANTHA